MNKRVKCKCGRSDINFEKSHTYVCIGDLCFSNIPSKSDWYKYHSPRFFLGKCLREWEINKKKKVYPFAHCVGQ